MNERILKILSMCLQAKENGHDCFFSYRAHIEAIEIDIHVDGYKSNKDPCYNLEAHTDKNSCLYKESELEEIENALIKLI